MRLLRSGPAITRSIASSSSLMPIVFLLRRAARIAAFVDQVLQVGAREAGRLLAPASPASRPSPAACRARAPRRIAMRPLMSGRSSTTWRSKRPGRSSAGSSTSGRLVAAITMTLVLAVEAVHLDQDLVQRLLALVVASRRGRRRAGGRPRRSRPRRRCRARCAWPGRTGRARGWRRRRRTSRRTRSR